MSTYLNDIDFKDINELLWRMSNSLPTSFDEREKSRELQAKISNILLERKETERKRQAIAGYYTGPMAHPAIKIMSPDRVERTYKSLVEAGKIKEGEN